MNLRILVLCASAMLAMPSVIHAVCGVERWPVKVAADADALLIKATVMPSTIETLRAIPAPRPLPQDHRLAPVETTIYSVTATLVAYRLASDGSIQLVLSDAAGRTIVAQLPAAACAAGSRYLNEIADVRRSFERRFVATDAYKETRTPVEVRGVGFFDFLQGQRGAAPNGLALYPLIAIDFSPLIHPTPPPARSRRRAVRTPGAPVACVRPSLSITASQNSVCGGENMTVSWQASSASATVSIDGIGSFLPASGSRVTNVATNTIFSGRASNACGAGDESVAVVTLKASTAATLSGPSSVKQKGSASLSIGISGATSWKLTSSLSNSISPSSGTSSGSARYEATHIGTDVVTLVASGGPCGSVTRTITINVTPETTTGGLACCDGTRSPSCFNCGDKRGCCSGHGGVCGCATTVPVW